MNIQVLVASMNQTDHSLLGKMNIQSDVIVGNQCDRNEIEDFEYKGFKARYLNFSERGVGLNRNNALMRATGDVCLLADDDMVFEDNYPEIVKNAFAKHKDADVIIFNLHEPVQTRYVIPKDSRVGRSNYLRYGAARVAFKLSSVKGNAIYFNQCFGGGTEYPHGEDNIFLTDCLNKGLKIYAVPQYIASLTEERESTWNAGYDEKYLIGQGHLYRAISRRWWKFLCLQDAIRHSKRYNMSWSMAYKIMVKG